MNVKIKDNAFELVEDYDLTSFQKSFIENLQGEEVKMVYSDVNYTLISGNTSITINSDIYNVIVEELVEEYEEEEEFIEVEPFNIKKYIKKYTPHIFIGLSICVLILFKLFIDDPKAFDINYQREEMYNNQIRESHKVITGEKYNISNSRFIIQLELQKIEELELKKEQLQYNK